MEKEKQDKQEQKRGTQEQEKQENQDQEKQEEQGTQEQEQGTQELPTLSSRWSRAPVVSTPPPAALPPLISPSRPLPAAAVAEPVPKTLAAACGRAWRSPTSASATNCSF